MAHKNLIRSWPWGLATLFAIVIAVFAVRNMPTGTERMRWVHFGFMMRPYSTKEMFAPQKRLLIVQAEWGMCNRLRSYNVAYEMALRSGRELVMINDSKHYEKFWDGDWTQLFHAPPHARFEPLSFLESLEDHNVHQMGTPQADCAIAISLAELNKASERDCILFRTCEVLVDDMEIKNKFYKSMKVTDEVSAMIASALDFIKREHCVGVHIRQGNIPDYNQGYFFGEWKKDGTDKAPVLCCFDDKSKNASPCPDAAPGVERFVEAMQTFPDETKFFVCTDRPGCLMFLEALFPNRVFYTSNKIEEKTDFIRGFCDWYCLGHCAKLLLSAPSSFSVEAAKLHDVPCEYIDPH